MVTKGIQFHSLTSFNRKLLRKVLFSWVSVFLALGMLLPTSQNSVQAASGPTLISPNNVTVTATGENGTLAAPPVALPVFTWEGIQKATSYRIQFGRDTAFTNPFEFTTALTQFTPVNVAQFPDGGWYWRVREDAPIVSDYSAIGFFTKQWASPANLPYLLQPADSASLAFYDHPIFSWNPVIGAASYEFQVSKTTSFLNLEITQETISTTYQPATPLQNGIFYWRVIPLSPDKRDGTPSSYRSFMMSYDQVPVLLEPGDGSTPTFTPTLRWTAVRGANTYKIQISTDPSFATGFLVNTNTKNTTYTLTSTLDNDKNYYWRVCANNGTADSNWSGSWSFTKRWYIQPVLLTPTSSYQYVRFPFFSWTPVPGAANYKIEVTIPNDPSFNSLEISDTTSNPFYSPKTYKGDQGLRYWRVTPYDGSGKQGKPSAVRQYSSSQYNNAPDLVSPLYYYLPNTFPSPDQGVAMNPYEDRSVAHPLFTWSRLFDFKGNIFAGAYRLRLGTTINPDGTVGGVLWSMDTENLSAAPLSGQFTPVEKVDYYWQVTPLDGLGGNPIGNPSQVWKTRFDQRKALESPGGTVPQLLRPAYPANNPGYDSSEFVEITPALEWFPVAGATSYKVQISRTSNFSGTVADAVVDQPVYVPITSYGQRSLGHLNFGSYFWKVQALSGSNPLGPWSDPWRFEIAAQSQWQYARILGDGANRLEIARDSAADGVAPDYALSGLYAAQDQNYWYFGFDYSGTGDATYALYLDLDNRNNSGATVDERGYPLSFNNAHLPEYAIYIDKTSGSVSTSQVLLYHWTGSGWGTGVTLGSVGGDLSTGSGYIEIKVPYDQIGMELTTGTYSIALSSVNQTNGYVQDTVPENPIDGAGSAFLDQFASVSEHISLSAPLNNMSGDPTKFSSTPPFFWGSPVGAPWAGFTGEIYLDAQFTTKVGTLTITSNAPYYAPTSNAWQNNLQGDNTYYWRIRPRYLYGNLVSFGSWSQASKFELQGFVPQNLSVSISQATPTFSWDRVEGAATYILQVDTDSTFASPEINVTTTEPKYTPTGTLANGDYYWRVEARRKEGVTSLWTPQKSFKLSLPQPSGLAPDDPSGVSPIGAASSLCWDNLSVSKDGFPVLFASKYRLVVSRGDPTFSSTFETTDTIQNCWTPTKGYPDGKYYWKVAMIDGDGHPGNFSEVASFTKQYPTAVPKTPGNASTLTSTPTFSWTAVDGTTPYVFGAAKYKIEISQSSNYSPIFDSTITNSTVFTPTKQYPLGGTYYWHVAIMDKDGNIGPFSDATIILDPNGPLGKLKTYLPFIKK